MTDTYKLTYFNARALAEVSRLMFAIANVKYEDKRYPTEGDRPEWKADKGKYYFEKIPELEYNGHVIPQSKAIERFLAKKLGFAGNNEVEGALIDAYSEQIRDINISYGQVKKREQEREKKEKRKKKENKEKEEKERRMEKKNEFCGKQRGRRRFDRRLQRANPRYQHLLWTGQRK
eukprot:Phypoly_transcript_15038.p1 GENE.Phypoly_transcript_15038~~Phypoly_transcript_15038.p1  ORF type:complete len:176 (+),score=36.61 Phypoly_transcript_15038:66-593(+)